MLAATLSHNAATHNLEPREPTQAGSAGKVAGKHWAARHGPSEAPRRQLTDGGLSTTAVENPVKKQWTASPAPYSASPALAVRVRDAVTQPASTAAIQSCAPWAGVAVQVVE